MSEWPRPDELRRVQAELREVARRFLLVVHQARGRAGAQRGRGAGASVEIEDHRPFVPGDDPRHVDWNAFGRTGQLVAKTFRAEVAPAVDLAFDGSRSMALAPAKRARALELFYLVLEGARRAGASLRVHVIVGDRVRAVPTEGVDAGRWLSEAPPADREQRPELARVPWRPDALRAWVSDLLYPGPPTDVLRPLVLGAGRAVVLAPAGADEASPSWQGNLTLVDAETGRGRAERVDAGALERYRAAYARHFGGYSEAAVRLGVALARVEAEPPLAAALVKEAVPRGVLTPWA